VLAEAAGGVPQAVIIGTGSELQLALQAQALLAAQGVAARVVSMPCTSVFDRQSAAYQDSVLPRGLPTVAVEAAQPDFWRKYVGREGAVVGIASFGESAPAGALYKRACATCPALLSHTLPRLQDEKPQALCQYAGKVLLVVNTASYCGFTSQFEGLEALNAKYASRGLVVMGFPSNDFKQEDADAKKTADVCFSTYGVKFPMFMSIPVRGKDAHPLFAQLAKATGQAPSWNFNKYLVDRQGRPLAHFGSTRSKKCLAWLRNSVNVAEIMCGSLSTTMYMRMYIAQ
jgi:glutathione peroxidase